MAENIFLEVVTPSKAVVSEEAQIVVAPGSEGEFGVLKGHTTFLTSLKVGTLRYKDSSGKEKFVFINGGFAEALPNKVTLLAESAEKKEDIDIERAKQAKERAERRLAAKAEDFDFARAEAALRRAIHRLSVVNS
ncbi:ATP synthase epsilon chain [Desulfamplus magnetovallimortis]|jgi:F-type H+-transporting ATPase subunit epsilon|uniref:ATP synthase epsilon chain n=1 Tax=Desulfamplus magnetovallimortis TaxID=1246637 RepID=A0A1W1H943_9BACT|nr:F0F1 ATP synthase subunit epsilon [Desulfamplus magnetovallimortis]SLM28973.1 ATP synthase epsilon chain [Desulfamplus magnetovallimortis]